MNTGTIELIYIAPAATAPTLSVKQAVAIPGPAWKATATLWARERSPSLNPTSN